MKNIFFIVVSILFISVNAQEIANRLLMQNNTKVDTISPNLVTVVNGTASNNQFMYSVAKSRLKWDISQVIGLQSALNSKLSAETDPIWNSVSSQYRTKLQNDALYQPLGSYITTEVDPTVPLWAKASTKPNYTATEVGAYPSTGNPSGFLTTITSGQVTTALGYTPVNPNGSSSQYIAGDGTKVTFPTIPVIPSRVFNNGVSRSTNSNYTISSTRDASVSYSVTLSVTNPLLAGSSTATAFLEYSTNAGSSWVTVSQTGNSSAVGIAVAIAITNTQTTLLTGVIPTNALVRIRTVTAGTASVTYITGQEILL